MFSRQLPLTICSCFCRTIVSSSTYCNFRLSISPVKLYPSRSFSAHCYWIPSSIQVIVCTYLQTIFLICQFQPFFSTRFVWVEYLLILSFFLPFLSVFCCLTRGVYYFFSIFPVIVIWPSSSMRFIVIWVWLRYSFPLVPCSSVIEVRIIMLCISSAFVHIFTFLIDFYFFLTRFLSDFLSFLLLLFFQAFLCLCVLLQSFFSSLVISFPSSPMILLILLSFYHFHYFL